MKRERVAVPLGKESRPNIFHILKREAGKEMEGQSLYEDEALYGQ